MTSVDVGPVNQPRASDEAYVTMCCKALLAACPGTRQAANNRYQTLLPRFKRLLRIMHPLKLPDHPDNDRRSLFHRWCGYKVTADAMTSTRSCLVALSAHETIIAAMDADEPPDIVECFRKCRALPPKRRPSIGYFGGHVQALRLLNNCVDLSCCGDISLSQAADFCAASVPSLRNNLLICTGFKHDQQRLKEEINKMLELKKHFVALGGSSHKYEGRFSYYVELRDALRMNPDDLSGLPVEEIADRVASLLEATDRPDRIFSILEQELHRQHREDDVRKLEDRFTTRLTRRSTFESLQCLSPWHHQALERISQAFWERHQRTAFRARREHHIRVRLGRTMKFLRDHSASTYQEDIQQQLEATDALQWFVENCTLAMAKLAARSYVEGLAVRNDRVKSAREHHHGKAGALWIVAVFKDGLSALLPGNLDLSTLTLRYILKGIENKRVAANPSNRRTYRDEEMDALMEACKEDTRWKLILTILREIGLRQGCITHLKYFMLVDSNHLARHSCRVPEKAQSHREFITSYKLKQAIQSYYNFLRSECTLPPNLDECYVFNLRDFAKPMPSLHEGLKEIAFKANIRDVIVHAHAFRHTIVGKLMDAGNPIELVSKFMGHKSVSITNEHYWVPTPEEIHDKLKNPFNGQLQEQRAAAETENMELELIYRKRDTCMQIIHRYNTIIGMLAQTGGSAADVQRKIMEMFPNLGELLATINESISGSVSGRQSMPQDQLAEGDDAAEGTEEGGSDAQEGIEASLDAALNDDSDDCNDTSSDEGVTKRHRVS